MHSQIPQMCFRVLGSNRSTNYTSKLSRNRVSEIEPFTLAQLHCVAHDGALSPLRAGICPAGLVKSPHVPHHYVHYTLHIQRCSHLQHKCTITLCWDCCKFPGAICVCVCVCGYRVGWAAAAHLCVWRLRGDAANARRSRSYNVVYTQTCTYMLRLPACA